MIGQPAALIDLSRTVSEQCELLSESDDFEVFRRHRGMNLNRSQVIDGRFTIVRCAGAADLAKLRVEKLFEPCATATSPRMMEFDFKGLEFGKQIIHGRRVCAV